VHLVTSSIFTDEYMTKEDIIASLKTYFHDLAEKLSTPEALRTLIADFLLKRFVQTRNSSFNANQRMAFIRALSSGLQAVRKRELIDQESIKQVLTAVIEFFYMQKEDTYLKESYADFLKLFEYSDQLSSLAETFKKAVTKSANIWHVHLVTDLMEKGLKDLQGLVAAVQPHFKQMLNTENLKTTVNYPIILALAGFHARASLYLSDPSAFNWIYGTEILGYFATSKGYVNTLTYF
jgi:hypothetical protein